MPFEDPRSLAAVGLRPEGTGPSILETVIGGASQMAKSYLEGQEQRVKKEKDKVDMYVSLRKAGYTKEQAYEASLKTTGLMKPGGEEDTLDEQVKKMSIEKDKALTEKYKAEEKVAKKKLYTKGALVKPPNVQEQMRSDLRDKYNRGETLKPEEMKLLFGYQAKTEEAGFSFSGSDTPGGKTTTLKPEYTPPMWLQRMIGSWHTPAIASEGAPTAPAPKTTPAAETKIIQGTTYKRGSDGKWHKS